MNRPNRRLGELTAGERGRIARVGEPGVPDDLTRRFLEMGFVEGAEVELVHEAPFGSDPIAVRVRGALIALRRAQANQVEVTLEEVGNHE